MNTNPEACPVRGPSRFSVRKLLMVALAITCSCVVLSGCKATSTLTVTLGEKTSGEMKLRLVLDQEASSVLRRDSYDTTTLSKIFDTDALKKAGFKVSVKDNTDASSTIDISASFANEKQLRTVLSVLAPPETLSATLTSDTSLLNEKQKASIVIDVSLLRSMYLEDANVKKAVEEAGIDFAEFETLVNDAMKSTTFTVVLKQSTHKDSVKVTRETKKKETVAVSHDVFRTRYVANMVGAIIAGVIALVLFWRLCRTPHILLKRSADVPKRDASEK